NKSVFTFGNILAEYLTNVDKKFLEKYDLLHDQCILMDKKRNNILKDMKDTYPYILNTGGSSYNTMKMIQWLSGSKTCTNYVGCVGVDALGDIITEQCENSNINVNLDRVSNKTGYCCVLISKTNNTRSMVTYLGSSLDICDDFMSQGVFTESLFNSDLFYITGYIFLFKSDILLNYAKECFEIGIQVFYSIAAEYICQSIPEEIEQLMEYVYVVIGNRTEFHCFGRVFGINCEFDDLLMKRIFEKLKEKYNRSIVLIMTRAEDPVIMVKPSQINTVDLYTCNTVNIQSNQIIDTCGAGDAFAGGFIYGYLLDANDYEKCMQIGVKAAKYILTMNSFQIQDVIPPFM
ncbi:Adenosine kinase, partial [Intoshia linei]